MKFTDLRLAEPILRAVAAEGYVTATPIQSQTIPEAMTGRDVLGCAQTGTGKTAAFALPVLHRLSTIPRAAGAPPRARCLVLCPTRELAIQIDESFRTYGRHLRLRTTTIFGGVNQFPQVKALRSGLEIIVATPGRLLDLMEQGHVDLRGIETLVLDEADRMLDMGFIRDIEHIVSKLPASGSRQTMLFSATMPAEIRRLSKSWLRNPATVQIASESTTAERVEQCVYFVPRQHKTALLAHLVGQLRIQRGIVFTRTKHGADRVVRQLHQHGTRAEAIHGNKSQNARRAALENFRAGRVPLLVATDIASRGIDVDDVTHVINFDLTHEPETYIHRIGRTGRAGASGLAMSFCDHDERGHLRAIEQLIRQKITVRNDHPPLASLPSPAPVPHAPTYAHTHPRPQRQAAHTTTHGIANDRSAGHAPRPRAPHPAAGGHTPARRTRSRRPRRF